MNDEKIMKALQDHYDEALKYFPKERIIALCLCGSQNYGLATETSDVDTKLIVLPSLDDIVFNKSPISTTHIRANNEHIDFKDVRLMFSTFRNQNINFIETIFTKYSIVNPLYADLWQEIIDNREKIARYNENKTYHAMKGVAHNKYKQMFAMSPGREENITKYGYDTKSLHHLLRIKEFLIRYQLGELYEDCLVSKNQEYLTNIKKGCYNYLEAKNIADHALQFMDEYCKELTEREKIKNNPEVDELLDRIQSQLVRRGIKLELQGEDNGNK